MQLMRVRVLLFAVLILLGGPIAPGHGSHAGGASAHPRGDADTGHAGDHRARHGASGHGIACHGGAGHAHCGSAVALTQAMTATGPERLATSVALARPPNYDPPALDNLFRPPAAVSV
jgi:hypothetical protein